MPSDFAITTPTPGSSLTGSVVNFEWTADADVMPLQWYIRIGTVVNGNQYYQYRILDVDARSHVVTGLPLGGQTVHVSLRYKQGDNDWTDYNAYTYTAYDAETAIDPPTEYEPEDVAFYEEWLLDSSRHDARVLLIEIEHSAGTVRIASLPWIDDITSEVYDDWILEEPEIEDQLTDFSGIGEIDAINAINEENWLSYNWRGYPCRWYLGDVAWPRVQFRQIASTLIDGIRMIDTNQFRFDLMDAGQHLAQTFAGVTEVRTNTAKGLINHVTNTAGLPSVNYYNVDLFVRNYQVKASITPDTLVSEIIRDITRSIGAYIRVSQSGDVEVFIPDTAGEPTVTLTNDDVVQASVQLLSTTPTYKTVRLIDADGVEHDQSNAVPTGEFDQIIEIDTLLYQSTDIDDMLDYYADYYAVRHYVWEFGVADYASLLQVGDFIGIDVAEVTGEGIISRIRRSPLSAYTTVEITI